MVSINDNFIRCVVEYIPQRCVYQITGNVSANVNSLEYLAANSPDLHFSSAGSALPFADKNMAFDPSNNCGKLKIQRNGKFSFTIRPPNSYYTIHEDHLNSSFLEYLEHSKLVLVKPHVQLRLKRDQQIIKEYAIGLNQGYPNRSLTSLPEKPSRIEP